MKIHNVRLGLAANSSSSHSIVLLPGCSSNGSGSSDFGWDYFTAADESSKTNYLGCLVRETLKGVFDYYSLDGKAQIDRIMQDLYPDLPEDGYVDHQSVWGVPLNWQRTDVDREFLQDLQEFFVKNPIAILGGNDNGGDDHPLRTSGKHLDLPFVEHDDARSALVARKDGDCWTLFRRSTGAKVRFSFGELLGETPASRPPRAAQPELIDIKITDYCPYGCTYCYQASTTSGKHAPLARIKELAQWCSEMKVFEVAIGGGEPTLHPDFLEILRTFRAAGVIPNFTTRNLAWLKGPDALAIAEAMGSFAFSVDHPKDVERLVEAAPQQNTITRQEYSVQYVVGSGGDLYGVLRAAIKARLRVTLLGFKHTGFGAQYAAMSENWIGAVEELRVAGITNDLQPLAEAKWINVAVDTALIQSDKDGILNVLNVNPILMTEHEGKFSMYIDAVQKRIGPSSYCEDTDYAPLTTKAALLESFNQW